MKRIILSLLVLVCIVGTSWSQTSISETFDVKDFDELDLAFEYPEIVRIKVWDQPQVKIEGTVDIQDGEFDEDFELRTRKVGNRFGIESKINNLSKHKRMVVWSDNDDDDDDDDGGRTVVTSDKGVNIYTGSGKSSRFRNGLFISIELEVTIPKDMLVTLDARYGIVEVLESPKSLTVDARYGGVDVMISESQSVELDAKTQWGQIFSNLDIPLEVGGNDMIGKWMKAHAALKRGDNRLSVESQYGNVYLRKNQ